MSHPSSETKAVGNKRIRRFASAVSLAAITAGAMVVAPSAAQATGFDTWTRSCGTTYSGFSSAAFAYTEKRSGGTCKGDAWARVYFTDARGAGHWTGWKHHAHKIIFTAVNVVFWNAQHKGCADCEVHGT